MTKQVCADIIDVLVDCTKYICNLYKEIAFKIYPFISCFSYL